MRRSKSDSGSAEQGRGSRRDGRKRRGRRIVRLVLRLGFVAGVAAALRSVLGRSAGEPEGPAGRGTPMSFDRWPAVPEAPERRQG